jgi:hypothetical protein
MASAEQLLNEAQYAFANISFGESFANARYAARAKSMCRRIIRSFPTTTEAQEAHAILRRLGEESYTSEMPVRHSHQRQSTHHEVRQPRSVARSSGVRQPSARGDTLDWSGLLGLLFGLPKALLFAFIAAGFVLFSIFGWFMFVPLVALVLFSGPFRSLLQPAQRDQLKDVVARINAFIDERRGSGGFS